MDDLKRYPPTARRLARLRQAGQHPDTTALAGAASLVGLTVVLVWLGPHLICMLQSILARDLQLRTLPVSDLPRLLAWHLGLGAVVVIALGGLVAALAAMARRLQAGPAGPGGTAALLPLKLRRPNRGGMKWPGLTLGVMGLLGGGVVMGGLLQAWGAAESWRELWAWGPLCQAWGRWLAALTGLALLHMLWSRAAYLQQAQMSHRELVEEQRETEGPPHQRSKRH